MKIQLLLEMQRRGLGWPECAVNNEVISEYHFYPIAAAELPSSRSCSLRN
jgi:hypothetical protein